MERGMASGNIRRLFCDRDIYAQPEERRTVLGEQEAVPDTRQTDDTDTIETNSVHRLIKSAIYRMRDRNGSAHKASHSRLYSVGISVIARN